MTTEATNGRKTRLALDLDVLEREGDNPGPFQFQHEGETFELIDPQEIDWQDLLIGMRNPALFLRSALPEDQQRKFLDKKLPSWKMNALLKGYQEHFGLPSLGELSALLR